MKLALAWIAAAGAAASAAPIHPQPTAIRIPRNPAPVADVSSHIIYLHRCDVSGCVVHYGMTDDSRTSTSSIADGDRTIGAFSQSRRCGRRRSSA